MNEQEKIVKLTEIRDSIKSLITEYNTLSSVGIDLDTRVILLTVGGSTLLNDEQIKELEEKGEVELDGEYISCDEEYITTFAPKADQWIPSSLNC